MSGDESLCRLVDCDELPVAGVSLFGLALLLPSFECKFDVIDEDMIRDWGKGGGGGGG